MEPFRTIEAFSHSEICFVLRKVRVLIDLLEFFFFFFFFY